MQLSLGLLQLFMPPRAPFVGRSFGYSGLRGFGDLDLGTGRGRWQKAPQGAGRFVAE